MDIGTDVDYLADALSNFAPHKFTIDGIECASMEGFLQSLKFQSPEMQIKVCKLVGKAAKFKGKKKKWYKTQTLYWQGKEYKRDSKEYQELLDRAYNELSKNEDFIKALILTGDTVLVHSIGKEKINETVLTSSEFTSRLLKIRENYMPV